MLPSGLGAIGLLRQALGSRDMRRFAFICVALMKHRQWSATMDRQIVALVQGLAFPNMSATQQGYKGRHCDAQRLIWGRGEGRHGNELGLTLTCYCRPWPTDAACCRESRLCQNTNAGAPTISSAVKPMKGTGGSPTRIMETKRFEGLSLGSWGFRSTEGVRCQASARARPALTWPLEQQVSPRP